ncbi:kinase-like domain-containing protein [Rhizophagus clarus]|uniref:Kinase-like domain-containing protein n=1 Tax=Rhizophagus clarus TaxID=94130 RepID=A0A8H3QV06_9GLOM|nr:kinase-like domain-containing protein [Rhizophagus clarus]
MIQNTPKSNSKFKKCIKCSKYKKHFNEIHQTCWLCYEANKIIIPSGNKVIDDFIRYTITNSHKKNGKMVFVPYDKFKDVEFIAEGRFSKINKTICIDGLIYSWSVKRHKFSYQGASLVALKELNNSKNISSKDLNELKIFYNISLKETSLVCNYLGITQHPATQNFMIITKYYDLRDLTHYITNDFFNISWNKKLHSLWQIAYGIKIKNYTCFGMIMWELMTGRKPFWDRSHDTELIIKICDGLRPPIVTNAPEGYIELMKECWHPDPNKRPISTELQRKVSDISHKEHWDNATKIIASSDIGPITNNPNAIYKSRPLSAMIRSAESTRSLRSQSQNILYRRDTSFVNKRKFNNNFIENNEKDEPIKRIKFFEIENDDYLTKELELDIDDNNINFGKSGNNDYITEEINFDI